MDVSNSLLMYKAVIEKIHKSKSLKSSGNDLSSPSIMMKQFTLCLYRARLVTNEERHRKTDLKVFVIVIPKEVWARMAAPILLLV